MSLSLATALAGWSRPQEIGRVRGIPSLRSPRYGSPGRSLSMERFVNPFVADGSSTTVIEFRACSSLNRLWLRAFCSSQCEEERC